ncbi:DUF2516 family protein [Mycolicibacterium grossiae]|uniref:DUF2516 domain-containing protein n=2 Tax=Mycolicibacterium grossiae TaxID=1552759 RepID=A0A1E8Q4C6_9MYCO|nr:hypothetical protein BEL07_16040 [Mycolicibacterium grossiae]QEM44997.1 DUF2516 family protein [Mycolicibacterium grossiae]
MEPQYLMGYVLFAIQVAALAMAAYAFVHAASQRPDAFTAAEKLSKPVWLAIIGGTALLAFILGAPVGSAIVACAAGVYIVDVRPKVLDVQGKSR